MLISGVYLADSSNSEEYQSKNGNNIPCKIDHCIYAVKHKLSEEKNFTVRESNHFLETLMLLKKDLIMKEIKIIQNYVEARAISVTWGYGLDTESTSYYLHHSCNVTNERTTLLNYLSDINDHKS